MGSPFKHFTWDEFDSPATNKFKRDNPNKVYFKNGKWHIIGSGKENMSEVFIRRLDIARDCADFSFKIERGGGYRTWDYNTQIGGASLSSHPEGEGSDIDYKTEEDLKIILRCLIKVGFNRFGIRLKGSGKSVHVDMSTTKKQFIYWGYKDKQGNYISPPNPWQA